MTPMELCSLWPGLRRLFGCVEQYRERIISGEAPLRVDGYCNSRESEDANLTVAKTRSNRVKSELITRKGLEEEHFITRNHTGEGDFVTVRIVVPKTSPIPSAKDVETNSEAEKETAASSVKEEKEDTIRQRSQTPQPVQPEKKLPMKVKDEEDVYTLAFRANLLRWATLTPDVGFEWRINKDWGIQVNGSWTSWGWNDKDRRYALWEVSPEVRHYIGKEKRGYVGAMYHVGQFNYKLSDTGKQGDLMGGGITGGYQLELNRSLRLDFSLGVGCTHADYEKYTVVDGVRVKRGKENKNYWGVNHAGITLVWKLK